MNAEVFVDTNVLVYARDTSEPEKQRVAGDWLAQLWERRLGRISYQVLFEYYVCVTAKLKPGLPVEDARRDVEDLAAWQPLGPTPELLSKAWELEDRYSFSWWDSAIVAAATLQGCRVLLSEDLHDGLMIGDLEVINPFRIPVGEWLGDEE
jgi:predicted nucleic acid-binding protein